MVYTDAAYHDIGHHINPGKHEEVSAEILASDKKLKRFFGAEQILTMAEAVEDHRASSGTEPRSIYGKILSSADRRTSVREMLASTYTYRLVNSPHMTLDEIIEDARTHVSNKFGDRGYALKKMYFYDFEYANFLAEVTELLNNKPRFLEVYKEVMKEYDQKHMKLK